MYRVLALIVVVLAACSPSSDDTAPRSCLEYSQAASQLMLHLAADSTAAESLIAAGAERDFDEEASAQLAGEFSRISAEESRTDDLARLGYVPTGWVQVSDTLAEVVGLHESAFAQLAQGFETRDAAVIGEAAMKMARALEIQAELGERWPAC